MLAAEILTSILIGLICGSFSTALTHRIPQGGNWVSERSACPACGHHLGVLDLFPVFSWLLSRGKCRYCKAGISMRYPATELACALLCLGIYAIFGFTAEGLLCMACVPVLMSLFLIDIDHFILPNQLMLALFAAGALRLMLGWTQGFDVMPYIVAALCYGFLSWGLGFAVEKALKKEALGFGDVKFFFVAGLWLGIDALPYFLMLSGVSGVIFALGWRYFKNTPVFPFGPALIASFYILLLYQGAIMV